MMYPGKSPYTMLSVEDCVEMVASHVKGALGQEEVPLGQALGRILAQDAIAETPIPAFPASIMDGFAVRSAEGRGSFLCPAAATAGERRRPLEEGHVRYITTGAPLPEGADAVVKVEDTVQSVRSDGLEVQIPASKPGANIRQVGSDTAQGERLLTKGCRLGAAELGILAALGMRRVQVYQEPKVAVLSTGDELVDVDGDDLDETRGQIRDCNRPLLCAMVKELGATPLDLGLVKDDLAIVRSALSHAFNSADVVITSGGVSRGSKDYIKEVLTELGEVHFGEMCMKPGKPSTFATVGPRRRLFFGLPGNPVSCFVTFKLLAAPAIEKLRGRPLDCPTYARVDAMLASAVQMDPDRPEYHRARARWESGGIVAESTGFQRSSRIASIAEANCLLEIPSGSGVIPQGQVVKALLLPGEGLRPEPEGFPRKARKAEPAPKVDRPQEPKTGLLVLGDAEGLRNLRPQLLERRPKEANAAKEVVERWCRQDADACDLVVVLANLGLGSADAEVLAALRSCLDKSCANLEELLLRRQLQQSPLAMLHQSVAGVRSQTLVVTVSTFCGDALTDILALLPQALSSVRSDAP